MRFVTLLSLFALSVLASLAATQPAAAQNRCNQNAHDASFAIWSRDSLNVGQVVVGTPLHSAHSWQNRHAGLLVVVENYYCSLLGLIANP